MAGKVVEGERVRAEILRRIAEGRWRPGAPLPASRILERELAASREAVREALVTLRTAGAVTGGHGRLVFVARAPVELAFDAAVPFLEPLRGAGCEVEARTVSVDRTPASHAVAAELALADRAPVVELVRVWRRGDHPVVLARAWLTEQSAGPLFEGDLFADAVAVELARGGVTLHPSGHCVDAVVAHPLDCEMLGVPRGTALLRERVTYHGSHGHPSAVTDVRYHPGGVVFRVGGGAAGDQVRAGDGPREAEAKERVR